MIAAECPLDDCRVAVRLLLRQAEAARGTEQEAPVRTRGERNEKKKTNQKMKGENR